MGFKQVFTSSFSFRIPIFGYQVIHQLCELFCKMIGFSSYTLLSIFFCGYRDAA